MHVDAHCVVCRRVRVAVHYQSLQAVTLEVSSVNTSLAEPNWGWESVTLKSSRAPTCLPFQTTPFPQLWFLICFLHVCTGVNWTYTKQPAVWWICKICIDTKANLNLIEGAVFPLKVLGRNPNSNDGQKTCICCHLVVCFTSCPRISSSLKTFSITL